MPIIAGTIVYYIFFPDVIFVKLADNLLGWGVHVNRAHELGTVERFLRFYFLDMMWAYAFVFSLVYIIGNNKAALRKIFMIAFAFFAFTEMLQLTSAVKGTFDVLDILFESLSEGAAVFIIKIYYLYRTRRKINEKEEKNSCSHLDDGDFRCDGLR
ncbi:MAG: hypothetical protein K6F84_03070 [Lachnospiraceae bacterium]|nr:hypothetical protein [Lachnospiraceae bacterium]